MRAKGSGLRVKGLPAKESFRKKELASPKQFLNTPTSALPPRNTKEGEALCPVGSASAVAAWLLWGAGCGGAGMSCPHTKSTCDLGAGVNPRYKIKSFAWRTGARQKDRRGERKKLCPKLNIATGERSLFILRTCKVYGLGFRGLGRRGASQRRAGCPAPRLKA